MSRTNEARPVEWNETYICKCRLDANVCNNDEKKKGHYKSIHSVNPLYFIIGEVDGYIECISIEEKDGNKYINFASIDKNKEVL